MRKRSKLKKQAPSGVLKSRRDGGDSQSRTLLAERNFMPITFLKASIAVLATVAAALAIAACGGDDNGGGGGGEAKSGGTLKVLDTAGGIDSLDPGYWYYQADYQEVGPTQRQLYGWKPDETTPTPDLAEDLPAASNGGKTLTIKIKPGVKYSAPLQTRNVSSKDVKYALERCFLPAVGNGYANIYYNDIE